MLKITNLSSLQIFQLIRYSTFVVIGVGFAKFRLPQSFIGQFETFIMVSGMVSFFWVSGIINSMLSIYPRKNDEEKKELLYNTFLSLIIFSFIAGGCLFLFANNLLSFLSKDNDKNLIKLSVIYLLLSNPSFIIEYIFFLNDKRG